MKNKKHYYSRYTVQIGKFKTREEALEVMKKMTEIGLTGYLVEKRYQTREIETSTTTKGY